MDKAILDTFENLWDDPDGNPTAVFIGCPHCNYEETIRWAKMFVDALDAAGQEKLAIPAYIFAPTVTRTRALLEEPEWQAFEREYCDVETLDGLITSDRMHQPEPDSGHGRDEEGPGIR